jgi:hypothetical protein
MRFDLGPLRKQLRALGNTKCGFCFDEFRGGEAAVAASPHTGRKDEVDCKEAIEKLSDRNRDRLFGGYLSGEKVSDQTQSIS